MNIDHNKKRSKIINTAKFQSILANVNCFRHMQTLRYHRFWLFVGFLLIVGTFITSLMPLQMGHGLPHQDKLLHMTGYGMLTLWFLQIVRNQSALFLIPLAMMLLGLSIEVLQGFTAYRYPDRMDALANTLGCIGAALLALTPLRDTLLKLERYLP